jgi:hypothetical protein
LHHRGQIKKINQKNRGGGEGTGGKANFSKKIAHRKKKFHT